ncbi:hypothetical protein K504DRAFT_458170 [Pleomassaria siparia CBS 279.74]|uniref:Indole-diterpene biosynthesis protein-like protein PaxU n=1 Tax=Pleomassaria siparia CBS 279.74 TaxID=1314801 RepID=A0A6G1K480_9PLEO|nr:hypothetical protein K504DRAFT_458170 [Pleomassaria siparia CBS 279.74]
MTTSMTPVELSSDARLYQPSNPSSSDLIVLCTWLGASQKHIAKYMALYQFLTPSTPILLIQSHIGTITRPYPAQRRFMMPALTVVENSLSGPSSTTGQAPKILIHTFSNGGSNSATQLLLAYREKTGKAMPLQAIICDSGPAKGEYWKSYRSMIMSMPKSLGFRLLGGLVAHLILLWMGSNARLGRYPIFEVLIRDTLLSEKFVQARGGGEDGQRKISYLWGKGDDLVDWVDIVDHAEEAKEKGWLVRSEEFVGSGHCGHLRVDAGKYTEAVRAVWED